MLKSTLDVFDLGIISYSEAWEIQQELHTQVRDGLRAGAIMILQHKPVITLGKNADTKFILYDQPALASLNIDLVRTDRGGEVTAHELGQVVVYPILPLQVLRLAPKLYVERLLNGVILTLADFGISAQIDEKYPGVWVNDKKICAIGIRVKERVSLHGLALNVCNPLDLFQMILACGIEGRGVTTMKALLSGPLDTSKVAEVLIRRLTEVLELPYAWRSVKELYQDGEHGLNSVKSLRSPSSV